MIFISAKEYTPGQYYEIDVVKDGEGKRHEHVRALILRETTADGWVEWVRHNSPSRRFASWSIVNGLGMYGDRAKFYEAHFE